ncbi:uncharacterized protein [Paramormyrops kingsleyae]|uniref:uncharacterized protein n=1 Tax=Paramormyrops kingsleyae TaxID=1676925 RepID=UPI000CD65821|nr:uncharacterized protein LOC111849655 [Paramormyrops kingsleyae]
MSPTKQLCPFCRVSYMNLCLHLTHVHKLTDPKERKLLNAITSKRYSGPVDCPVRGCTASSLVRLDRHLKICHKIEGQELKKLVSSAKQTAAKAALQNYKQATKEKDEEVQTLKRRLDELEKLVRPPAQAEDNTASVAAAKPGRATQLFFTEEVLPQYKATLFRVGASSKVIENYNYELKNVEKFVRFMWGNQDEPPPAHLKYIADPSLINNWMEHLNSKFKVTTIKNHLLAIIKFSQFLVDNSLPCVRLSQKRLTGIIRHLKCQVQLVTKKIVGHRQTVKDKKTQRMPQRGDLAALLTELRGKIPDCLDDLAESPLDIAIRNSCIGCLVTLLFSISGHRSSVIINMTLEEYNAAHPEGDFMVISVANHKTSGTFGRAKIALTEREHSWLQRFAQLRPRLPGFCHQPATFFFAASGQPFRKVNKVVTQTCLACGLPRGFSVSEIRTGVSTCIQRNLPEKQRQLVARLMCHSTQTADRFYVAEPDGADACSGRGLLQTALGMSKAPCRKTGQQSQSEEEVVHSPWKRLRLTISSTSEEDEPRPQKIKKKKAGNAGLQMQVTKDPVPLCSSSPLDLVPSESAGLVEELSGGLVPLCTSSSLDPVPLASAGLQGQVGKVDSPPFTFSPLSHVPLERLPAEEMFVTLSSDLNDPSSPSGDEDAELPSPLPKTVVRPAGTERPTYRRKLLYTDHFREKVKRSFSDHLDSPISTKTINEVLYNRPELLAECKDMALTIDNIRALLKQMQRSTDQV